MPRSVTATHAQTGDNRRHAPFSRRRRRDGPAVDRADETLFETLFERCSHRDRKRSRRLFRWVVGFAQSQVTRFSQQIDERVPSNWRSSLSSP